MTVEFMVYLLRSGKLHACWPRMEDLPTEACPGCGTPDPGGGMDDEVLELIRDTVAKNIETLREDIGRDVGVGDDLKTVMPTLDVLQGMDDQVTACRDCWYPERWAEDQLRAVAAVFVQTVKKLDIGSFVG